MTGTRSGWEKPEPARRDGVGFVPAPARRDSTGLVPAPDGRAASGWRKA